MVKEVRKEEAGKFMEKAEEFYDSALENYQKGRLNASAFDSSQAIILANDAFCIFVLGRRASKDHKEAIQMHVEASLGKESKKEIVSEALEKRTKFGYTEAESNEREANLLLLRSKRFIDWAKGRIG
jgi:HEPN domain-containing protein